LGLAQVFERVIYFSGGRAWLDYLSTSLIKLIQQRKQKNIWGGDCLNFTQKQAGRACFFALVDTDFSAVNSSLKNIGF
jgi:hypothetical protein